MANLRGERRIPCDVEVSSAEDLIVLHPNAGFHIPQNPGVRHVDEWGRGKRRRVTVGSKRGLAGAGQQN